MLIFLLIGLSLVANKNCLRRVMHLLGVGLCCLQVSHQYGYYGTSSGGRGYQSYWHLKYPNLPHAVSFAIPLCSWLLVSVAFCVMEVDRINGISAVSEAEDLQKGYQGQV